MSGGAKRWAVAWVVASIGLSIALVDVTGVRLLLVAVGVALVGGLLRIPTREV